MENDGRAIAGVAASNDAVPMMNWRRSNVASAVEANGYCPSNAFCAGATGAAISDEVVDEAEEAAATAARARAALRPACTIGSA